MGGFFPSSQITGGGFFGPASSPRSPTGATGLLLGGGIFLLMGPGGNTSVRASALFSSLANGTDIAVPLGAGSEPNHGTYGGGKFVLSDFAAENCDSPDGTTWTAGNPLPVAQGNVYGSCYDDLNASYVVAGGDSTGSVNTAPNANPLTWTLRAGVVAQDLGSVGYKGPGTGIILGQCGPGGAQNGNTFKSTDGGASWTQVGTATFGSSNAGLWIGFGQTHWLCVGGNGSQIQVCRSTDDGATWSAPITLPAPGGGATNAAVATDGAGRWLIMSNIPPPDNYWVSSDDGGTWSSPNLLTFSNSGVSPGYVVWDGANWDAVFNDIAFFSQFLATSPDGQHWTQLGTIMD